ncbi:DUF448 domain-containing protein [Pacificimonas sp. ICDLI1SI03]
MRQSHNEPVRTCILTRETGERDLLVRLALGPDGQVMPDLGAKAPGRGAWLGVDAPALRTAQRKGKLKGALGRAFKGEARDIPDDLADLISQEMQRRTLDGLGLEMKAGNLVFGFERVLSAAKSGAAKLLLHASDGAEDGTAKLTRALQNGAPEAKSLLLPLDRAALSMALGQGNVVHVAVTNAGAASRIEAAARRWRAFSGLDGTNSVSETDASEELPVSGRAKGVEG